MLRASFVPALPPVPSVSPVPKVEVLHRQVPGCLPGCLAFAAVARCQRVHPKQRLRRWRRRVAAKDEANRRHLKSERISKREAWRRPNIIKYYWKESDMIMDMDT